MNRFRPLHVLGVIVLSLLLAACSQGESPEKGAQIFWESFAQMDGSKLMERTCRAEQASTATAATAVQVMLSLFGGDVIGMGSDLKIDISGLTFRTVSTNGNSATVELSGVLRASMGLAAIPEVTYNTTMQMLREDDRWKLCDSDFWVNNPLAQQPGSGGTGSGGLVGAPDTGGMVSGASVTANAQWTPIVQEFDGVPMVQVPAGCFMMGSNNQSDEQPVHEQCFDRPFWIDQTEVTQAQFASFGGRKANANYFNGDHRPVENITWFEARDYCALRGGRLPTEAEWEYAARGPDGLEYPWGNEWNADYAVWNDNSGGQTADVGSRPAGASWVGALDMSGNVWEWVSSQYQSYPYSATDGREADTGDRTDVRRGVRGGSWFIYANFLRAAIRDWYVPGLGYYVNGVRCARSLS